MTRYTIDRFEGADWAVLEDAQGRTFNVPRRWLPTDAREGDILTASEQDPEAETTLLRFQLDPAVREERRAASRRLREKLPRGPKGDVSL